jgi:hypothetical protein
MTGTYAQYRRLYVISGLAHAPGATPFSVGAGWPVKGYRAEDFPQTEDLIHRFIAIPVGVNYKATEADYVGAEIRRIHGELDISCTPLRRFGGGECLVKAVKLELALNASSMGRAAGVLDRLGMAVGDHADTGDSETEFRRMRHDAD